VNRLAGYASREIRAVSLFHLPRRERMEVRVSVGLPPHPCLLPPRGEGTYACSASGIETYSVLPATVENILWQMSNSASPSRTLPGVYLRLIRDTRPPQRCGC
jgi:hypothetical protein